MIRMATEQDLPRIRQIYAPYVTETTYSFEYTVPSLEEFRSRFYTFTAQFPWLVWEENGTVLGYSYACAPFERAAYGWCAEPAIYVDREARGRGIGRKLYEALEEILRRQGYHRLYTVITTENSASVAFHEAVGYRQVAVFPGCGIKFGRRLGTIWMEKVFESVEIPSIAPISWRAVVENDSFFD